MKYTLSLLSALPRTPLAADASAKQSNIVVILSDEMALMA
jgi:hypothetical protein